MKTTGCWALALAAVLTPAAWAQRGAMPHYDSSEEVTVRGTVTAVQEVDCAMCGGEMGTHVKLRTDDGEREIMLGPASFAADRDFTLSVGDEIEVVGAPMMMMGGGDRSLVARQVRKGGKTLELRDRKGRPRWAGRGRRHRG